MNASPKIPGWMMVLPNHSFIGTEEIAQIYGINKSSVGRCIARGSVPTPVMSVRRAHGRNALKWKIGDIRKKLASGADMPDSPVEQAALRAPIRKETFSGFGATGMGKRR